MAAGASSQDQLRRALAARGIGVAQATISRDLAALGASRLAGRGGTEPRYTLAAGDDGALPLDPIRGLVDAVLVNASLIVVRTKAGAASTVARAIDDARFADVLGSVAGDDTVFVAPARTNRIAALAAQIRRRLGDG